MFWFDIFEDLFVHMNDQRNPALSWDDEHEERKSAALPGQRQKETGQDSKKETENKKEK